MPIKPKSLSSLIQRNDLRSKQDHDRRMMDPAQAQAAKVRSSATWQKVRQMVLDRDGVCVECERRGYTTEPTQVDHILPITQRPDLALTMSNLQALCTTCHARKSATERSPRTGTGAPREHAVDLGAIHRDRAALGHARSPEDGMHGEVETR